MLQKKSQPPVSDTFFKTIACLLQNDRTLKIVQIMYMALFKVSSCQRKSSHGLSIEIGLCYTSLT